MHGARVMVEQEKAVSLLHVDEMGRGRGENGRPVPVPMLPSEVIRIETAMYLAGVSDKTIREWAHRDGIGRQAEKHSPLHISAPALLMKADGQTATLERFRASERNHPAVAFYLERSICLLEEMRCAIRLRR